jgi:hypothetical protein
VAALCFASGLFRAPGLLPCGLVVGFAVVCRFSPCIALLLVLCLLPVLSAVLGGRPWQVPRPTLLQAAVVLGFVMRMCASA